MIAAIPGSSEVPVRARSISPSSTPVLRAAPTWASRQSRQPCRVWMAIEIRSLIPRSSLARPMALLNCR